MKELALDELDERLQRQVRQAREALNKGGLDYVIQVCGELLKAYPSAYEIRQLLWESLRSATGESAGQVNWLREKSSGVQFSLVTRSLLKKNPLDLVSRCDEALRKKQVFPEIFVALEKASESLEWLENKVLACRAIVELRPEKIAPRLALAEVLLKAQRPQETIDLVEWVLAREPTHAEAQELLKNASVAETLQRGNWDDTDTSFHSKIKDS